MPEGSAQSRRDGPIVAWHEVPGTVPPQKEPSRRVKRGVASIQKQKQNLYRRDPPGPLLCRIGSVLLGLVGLATRARFAPVASNRC
jgi:hypothetical protein